jgi:Formylglycinamide ribonucleotide amidotransferase linker domain
MHGCQAKDHMYCSACQNRASCISPIPESGRARPTYLRFLPVCLPCATRGCCAIAAQELGLAFDEWDLDFYSGMFQNTLRRDPTNVELFDMAQSNSEHSRHWFFGADIIIDGVKMPSSLMQLVKSTLKANPGNSVIGFKDNSSAIRCVREGLGFGV